MSVGSYNDILKRAREELSLAELRRLIRELSEMQQPTSGEQPPARTLYDALRDRGLVGFMQDGPADLSTNPQHLDGLGQHAE
jgi:hypothetical protein